MPSRGTESLTPSIMKQTVSKDEEVMFVGRKVNSKLLNKSLNRVRDSQSQQPNRKANYTVGGVRGYQTFYTNLNQISLHSKNKRLSIDKIRMR